MIRSAKRSGIEQVHRPVGSGRNDDLFAVPRKDNRSYAERRNRFARRSRSGRREVILHLEGFGIERENRVVVLASHVAMPAMHLRVDGSFIAARRTARAGKAAAVR